MKIAKDLGSHPSLTSGWQSGRKIRGCLAFLPLSKDHLDLEITWLLDGNLVSNPLTCISSQAQEVSMSIQRYA